MFRKISLVGFLLVAFLWVQARQGMWPPAQIAQYIHQMKAMGLMLEASELYNSESPSLNDAIIHFANGCTGGIISGKGLIITNFHCSHRQVQALSTLENNHIANGFWAQSVTEEIPVPGLFISITRSISDVTNAVLEGTDTITDDWARSQAIRKNITKLEAEAQIPSHQKASIQQFFQHNHYHLIITETYNDIRLVASPPASIGRFGGDTDNWMWPRHTGDFSLFRIYANAENLPADYHVENKPYAPSRFLPINIQGVKEGDFTMVYGFPGTTQSYLYSAEIDMLMNHSYPLRIAARDIKINYINQASRTDSVAEFRYSASLASISNAWKKWKGEIAGLRKSNAIAQKQTYETSFTEWINESDRRKAQYGDIYQHFDSLYPQFLTYQLAFDCFTETIFRGQDSYRVYMELNKLKNTTEQSVDTLPANIGNFFRNHTHFVERNSFIDNMLFYVTNLPKVFSIESVVDPFLKNKPRKAIELMYDKSPLTDLDKLKELKWLTKDGKLHPQIEKDQLFAYYTALQLHFNQNINPTYYRLRDEINKQQSNYMKAIMEKEGENSLYPDANSTLRISYGIVEGYRPADGVNYRYYTTIDGKVEKVSPHIDDYQLPDRLIELYQNEDYGRYALEGEPLRTCFIASNHTTGGNSGSPVLNAHGHLVGLNFDRCWEGTMSDLWYNPDICRNISLDMRYMLFLVDHFGQANYLLDEMKIIE